MKREHNGKELSLPTHKPKLKKERMHASWTNKEDEQLIKEAKSMEKINWRIVSKNMRNHFGNTKHTATECKKRFKTLESKCNKKSWSPNEDLVLFAELYFSSLIDWSVIDKLFRQKTNSKEYFLKCLLDVAKRVKEKKECDKGNQMFTEVLKEFICIKFILDEISGNNTILISDEIKGIQLKEEDCFWALNDLGRSFNMEIKWTRENLNSFLTNVMANIKNEIRNIDQINFDDIMHKRKPEENVDTSIQYCYVQIGVGPPILCVLCGGLPIALTNYPQPNNN